MVDATLVAHWSARQQVSTEPVYVGVPDIQVEADVTEKWVQQATPLAPLEALCDKKWPSPGSAGRWHAMSVTVVGVVE
jgi:hypothetical protein